MQQCAIWNKLFNWKFKLKQWHKIIQCVTTGCQLCVEYLLIILIGVGSIFRKFFNNNSLYLYYNIIYYRSIVIYWPLSFWPGGIACCSRSPLYSKYFRNEEMLSRKNNVNPPPPPPPWKDQVAGGKRNISQRPISSYQKI